MHKKNETLGKIRLVGLTTRTNNQAEQDPTLAKISPLVQKFFTPGLVDKIPNRVSPGVTYCVYTDYESDHQGEYQYFIGEAVESTEHVPEGFEFLEIPAQEYVKFTPNPGPMPMNVIRAWQSIWSMTEKDFGAPRAYVADFEFYDERAQDPSNAVFDIYIGVSR